MPRKIDENSLFGIVVNEWLSFGYESATTKAIALAAGVNEATLFRRYGNKAVLFAKAIDHKLATSPLSDVQITDDPIRDFTSLATSYIATFEAYGDFVFRILLEIPRQPDIRGAALNMMKNAQGMTKMIQHHQERGELRIEFPMLALAAFIGPIATYLMIQRSGLNTELPAFDVDAHVSGFLMGRGVTS